MVQLLPPSATAETRLLLAARGLRATNDGFVSIILPAYLLLLGFDALHVGVLATATLLGSALLTLAVGFTGVRRHTRALLIAASLLMVLTGLGFAALDDFWPLLVIAFVGTLNPSSGDVSVFLPLEHALLAGGVAGHDRTALFARYSLVGSLLGAAGTLLAALPELAASWGVAPLAAFKGMFLLYALGGLITALIYRQLGRAEVIDGGPPPSALGPSRRVVYQLAALFSLDAFAGGLVVQSLLALWLFQAFGLSLAVTAQLFFWSGLLTAVSYLAAAPLARRIGLINTMVFTHLPANLCLVAVPFAPELWQAIALLLLRSLLSQMHDAAKDFQADFIVANLDPLRALPILRVPGTGHEPDLNERQLHAKRRVHEALQALGGISSPAGSCVWHVVGLQRSVREWAIRQGWGGRPVRQEQAQGILVAALGMLAAHVGYGEARRAS
jgi:MFS family permease